MSDATTGKLFRAADIPPTGYMHDDTGNNNIVSTTYIVGSPEVGTFFIAPTSGRVRITVGGGARDNGATAVDRIFISPQIFLDDANGSELLAPSVSIYGWSSCDSDLDHQYGCRVGMISNLIPEQVYYARLMYFTDTGVDPDTADIAARDIIIIPVP